MASPRPSLVIASLGVSPQPINTTIFSTDEPQFRENGGDLRNGDRWFNTESQMESIYYEGSWQIAQSIQP